MFDPSQIKIGVDVEGYAVGGKDMRDDSGGVNVEAKSGLRKRQWHAPWSLVVSDNVPPVNNILLTHRRTLHRPSPPRISRQPASPPQRRLSLLSPA